MRVASKKKFRDHNDIALHIIWNCSYEIVRVLHYGVERCNEIQLVFILKSKRLSASKM